VAHLFKKILCAIDLNGSAPCALELAANLAQQVGAETHVLHVVRMPMPAEGAPGLLIEVCREPSNGRKDLGRASGRELPV
jgi:hypothetical protein